MAGVAPGTSGWIGGRAFDLAFFFGGSAVAALLGALMIAVPALTVPIWWLWMALVDGPHLVATWSRTYLDPDQRRRHRGLYAWSLLWLLPGPVAWLAMKLTGQALFFDAFLLFATLWAFHHAVRQHYGIMAVYERIAGTSPTLRRLDWYFIHLVPWGMYLAFLLFHPWSRKAMRLPMALSPLERGAAVASYALLFAVIAAYAVGIAVRKARGQAVRPAVFALGPVVGLLAFALFVTGRFEPVLPNPVDPEQYFLVSGFVGGVVHGLQYLGMIAATNRRRYTHNQAPTLAGRLGRAPSVAYAVFVGVSLLYVLVNLGRGNAPGAWLPPDHDVARLVLGLYWGLFFHHYYLDQKIWHPSHDAALQFELGLRSAA